MDGGEMTREAVHVLMCPVMADNARCVTVGGTDSHHDRGRAGDCRCGVKCQCELVRAVRADERSRLYGGQGWIAQEDVEAFILSARERLRAQVEALRDAVPRLEGGSLALMNTAQMGAYNRVLDLLDGEDGECTYCGGVGCKACDARVALLDGESNG
jgi:hypothetical protein